MIALRIAREAPSPDVTAWKAATALCLTAMALRMLAEDDPGQWLPVLFLLFSPETRATVVATTIKMVVEQGASAR